MIFLKICSLQIMEVFILQKNVKPTASSSFKVLLFFSGTMTCVQMHPLHLHLSSSALEWAKSLLAARSPVLSCVYFFDNARLEYTSICTGRAAVVKT